MMKIAPLVSALTLVCSFFMTMTAHGADLPMNPVSGSNIEMNWPDKPMGWRKVPIQCASE